MKESSHGFRANLEEFKKLNVEILQISADPVPSLKAWAEFLGGIPFPLLSDYWPHGAVGKAYGVFNEERGMDKRAAFLVDARAIVRYRRSTSREPYRRPRRCSRKTQNSSAIE